MAGPGTTSSLRTTLKRQLARLPDARVPGGAAVLIYHRVGGGSTDELDLLAEAFGRQVEVLERHRDTQPVVALDEAVDRLECGDSRPCVVLTFDDGFADVYEHAWPLLRERAMPFTIYLATAYVGAEMVWEGSTARAAGRALEWSQIGEMLASGLLTLGNHTHSHARPELLSADELDRCSAEIQQRLGIVPRHFAYPWGIPVPRCEGELRARFRTAATSELGRNLPGDDLLRMRRIPVRRTDPVEFFRAKLRGSLLPERAYAATVALAKRVGVRG